jgi:uncharacterized protein
MASPRRRRDYSAKFPAFVPVPGLAGCKLRSAGPALVCGSFSDNNLHSRGSFRGFERIASSDKFLYTHRGGKWAAFCSDEARGAQLAFFDHYLRGRDVPAPPRVRLEIRESRDVIASVREEDSWPLERTEWMPLYLTAAGLAAAPPTAAGQITFAARSHGARFDWAVPTETEVTGPIALRLFVKAHDADDVDLYAGVEKWRGRRYVPFEGSYGFGRDRVTTGWLKASLRGLDPQASRPYQPVPAFINRQPLAPGQIVQADIALGPSATLFRVGETLRLVVAARWLWPRNPLTGQFPAAYRKGLQSRCTLRWGPVRHRSGLRLFYRALPWPARGCYHPGSSTLRQVTQPSSFSNSLMSTTTGVKPRSSRKSAVQGADAAISTRSPPSGTT